MPRIKRASPTLVISIVALLAAVVGPAVGKVATTANVSKLNKQEKKQSRKIANREIDKRAPALSVASANNANNAGTADSANTADTANTANSANTAASAANADTLDGLDASDFASADEVHTPARFLRNDSTPGDGLGQNFDLLVAGPFTVRALCADNLNGAGVDAATVRVLGPNASSFSGMRTDGSYLNQPNSSSEEIASASSAATQIRAGHVVATAQTGEVVSVSASAEVGDGAADCVFSATLVGP